MDGAQTTSYNDRYKIVNMRHSPCLREDLIEVKERKANSCRKTSIEEKKKLGWPPERQGMHHEQQTLSRGRGNQSYPTGKNLLPTTSTIWLSSLLTTSPLWEVHQVCCHVEQLLMGKRPLGLSI
jgi:hypothetical protein